MSTPDDLHLDKSDPAVWKSLNAFVLKVRAATDATGLPRTLVELMNVRASQLNGCAYCLDLHTRQAMEAGETAQRLAVLSAWRDTSLFSDVEAAALRVTEAVTSLPDEETRTDELARARASLTDEQYSALAWAAIAINAYNRVSIVSRHPVRARP
ncbi:carboxymuconolactone decarboxylase family protein [Georgenia sp. EYE_87]|uniref:carboxymuconolactone decarboxylase family protein n=1 Tax=Georgenia sp. EYE_87 TaxID=2853448 RepID=UPI0020046BA9|nr:carboxymuconolactone decarboxylase family protein [Georgenia sp. EYE_87]MCK6212284.1 carboxymuconolactone decarboxylase family protein [Georgenia sp. EYE_87]